MTAEFKLEGFKELDRLLKKLPDEIAAKVLSKAFRAGAVVMRNAARDAAPVAPTVTVRKNKIIRPGTLRKSVRVSRPKKRIRATTDIIVTVKAGGRKAPHAWLVEHGSAPRVQENGRSTGSMPANPFMRRALDANARASIDRIKFIASLLLDTVATRLAFSVGSKK